MPQYIDLAAGEQLSITRAHDRVHAHCALDGRSPPTAAPSPVVVEPAEVEFVPEGRDRLPRRLIRPVRETGSPR